MSSGNVSTGMAMLNIVGAAGAQDAPSSAISGSGSAAQGSSAADEGPTLMEQMMAAQAEAAKAREKELEKQRKKSDKSFGSGLGKGFLGGGGGGGKKKQRKKQGASAGASAAAGGTGGAVASSGARTDPKPVTAAPGSSVSAAAPAPPVGSKKSKAKRGSKADDGGFGSGLAKGFLSGDKPKKKRKPKAKPAAPAPVAEEIPVIRKREAPTDAAAGLRMPEVQDAMKGAAGLLGDGNWMTPELLAKFATNPVLARGLANPAFKGLLESLQRDPSGTMTRAKDIPEAREFLQAFMSTMGDHFTKLGEEQDRQKAEEEAKAKAARDAASADPEVARVLADPEITALLQDPEMQRVLQEAQVPGKLRYFMGIPEIAAKLRKLSDAGLIQFAQ